MKSWKESIYTDLVRIRKKNKEYLVKTKAKKSLAGRLDEIINEYVRNHPESSASQKDN